MANDLNIQLDYTDVWALFAVARATEPTLNPGSVARYATKLADEWERIRDERIEKGLNAIQE